MRFEDAGGAGQGELGEVVLVEAFNEVGLRGGERGLRGDQRQVVVDAGVDAVGFIGQGAGGEVDVGAGDLDEFCGRRPTSSRAERTC